MWKGPRWNSWYLAKVSGEKRRTRVTRGEEKGKVSGEKRRTRVTRGEEKEKYALQVRTRTLDIAHVKPT